MSLKKIARTVACMSKPKIRFLDNDTYFVAAEKCIIEKRERNNTMPETENGKLVISQNKNNQKQSKIKIVISAKVLSPECVDTVIFQYGEDINQYENKTENEPIVRRWCSKVSPAEVNENHFIEKEQRRLLDNSFKFCNLQATNYKSQSILTRRHYTSLSPCMYKSRGTDFLTNNFHEFSYTAENSTNHLSDVIQDIHFELESDNVNSSIEFQNNDSNDEYFLFMNNRTGENANGFGSGTFFKVQSKGTLDNDDEYFVLEECEHFVENHDINQVNNNFSNKANLTNNEIGSNLKTNFLVSEFDNSNLPKDSNSVVFKVINQHGCEKRINFFNIIDQFAKLVDENRGNSENTNEKRDEIMNISKANENMEEKKGEFSFPSQMDINKNDNCPTFSTNKSALVGIPEKIKLSPSVKQTNQIKSGDCNPLNKVSSVMTILPNKKLKVFSVVKEHLDKNADNIVNFSHNKLPEKTKDNKNAFKSCKQDSNFNRSSLTSNNTENSLVSYVPPKSAIIYFNSAHLKKDVKRDVQPSKTNKTEQIQKKNEITLKIKNLMNTEVKEQASSKRTDSKTQPNSLKQNDKWFSQDYQKYFKSTVYPRKPCRSSAVSELVRRNNITENKHQFNRAPDAIRTSKEAPKITEEKQVVENKNINKKRSIWATNFEVKKDDQKTTCRTAEDFSLQVLDKKPAETKTAKEVDSYNFNSSCTKTIKPLTISENKSENKVIQPFITSHLTKKNNDVVKPKPIQSSTQNSDQNRSSTSCLKSAGERKENVINDTDQNTLKNEKENVKSVEKETSSNLIPKTTDEKSHPEFQNKSTKGQTSTETATNTILRATNEVPHSIETQPMTELQFSNRPKKAKWNSLFTQPLIIYKAKEKIQKRNSVPARTSQKKSLDHSNQHMSLDHSKANQNFSPKNDDMLCQWSDKQSKNASTTLSKHPRKSTDDSRSTKAPKKIDKQMYTTSMENQIQQLSLSTSNSVESNNVDSNINNFINQDQQQGTSHQANVNDTSSIVPITEKSSKPQQLFKLETTESNALNAKIQHEKKPLKADISNLFKKYSIENLPEVIASKTACARYSKAQQQDDHGHSANVKLCRGGHIFQKSSQTVMLPNVAYKVSDGTNRNISIDNSTKLLREFTKHMQCNSKEKKLKENYENILRNPSAKSIKLENDSADETTDTNKNIVRSNHKHSNIKQPTIHHNNTDSSSNKLPWTKDLIKIKERTAELSKHTNTNLTNETWQNENVSHLFLQDQLNSDQNHHKSTRSLNTKQNFKNYKNWHPIGGLKNVVLTNPMFVNTNESLKKSSKIRGSNISKSVKPFKNTKHGADVREPVEADNYPATKTTSLSKFIINLSDATKFRVPNKFKVTAVPRTTTKAQTQYHYSTLPSAIQQAKQVQNTQTPSNPHSGKKTYRTTSMK